MTIDKLKAIISEKARGNSSVSLQLYQMYFFECMLDRLSKSRYKYNIILKGGLLLSSVIGVDERTTKDMDIALKSLPLERGNVENIIKEIIGIELNDEITYEIVDIKDIRQQSAYGGFKVNILAMMSTLKVYLSIELTTGDKITPREIEYDYNCIFEDKKIPILAYTLETVIAEKYQTIIDRSIYNTRMKDFYDIYVLIESNREKIDFTNLTDAVKNTFRDRMTELDIDNIREQIENMRTSEQLIELWDNYQQTSPYSSDILFNNLFDSLKYITNILSDDNFNLAEISLIKNDSTN